MLCTTSTMCSDDACCHLTNERTRFWESYQSEHNNKEYIEGSVVKCCIDTSVVTHDCFTKYLLGRLKIKFDCVKIINIQSLCLVFRKHNDDFYVIKNFQEDLKWVL